jgi:adenylate kinase family enzyme
MENGDNPIIEISDDETSDDEKANDEKADDEKADDEIADGEIADDEIADGEIADGEIADDDDDQDLVMPELVILDGIPIRESVRKWREDLLATIRFEIQKIVERKNHYSLYFDNLIVNNPNNDPEDMIESRRNVFMQITDALTHEYQQMELMLLQLLQPA